MPPRRAARALTLAAVLASACGGEREGVDANPAQTCAQLRDDYGAVLATLDRSCDDDSDCGVVGAVDSCDCDPHLATACGGAPVQRAAYEAARTAELAPITAAVAAAGCSSRSMCESAGIPCACDCSPSSPRCSGSGQCEVEETADCWNFLIDAGVDAAPDAEVGDAAP